MGLNDRASGETWNKPSSEPPEMHIFAPSDLGELRAAQPHIISEGPTTDGLVGQLWRAVAKAGQIKDIRERDAPYGFICDAPFAKLADAVIPHSAIELELGKDLAIRASSLGLSAQECDDLGPRAELRRIAENGDAS